MDTAAAPAFAPDYDIAPGEDGVALVEALRAALPPWSGGDELYYEITSAIVHTSDGWVTLEVRERKGWKRDGVGIGHDVTIDLEDRMMRCKTGGKRLIKALSKALATLAPTAQEAAQ
jgi:hypothetical protein